MEANVVIEAGKACITLRGSFTIEHYHAFKCAVAQLSENDGLEEVSIDFSAVPMIDSTALGMLLLLRERLEGRAIRLFGVRGTVRSVLNITSLDHLFSIDMHRHASCL
ncbi:STAS domain-containing protein [Burkholderiaceae bacterium DAT-1]|nr:STAS domain-containing protein [Burkholderiaceae bacterium DAT-1]